MIRAFFLWSLFFLMSCDKKSARFSSGSPKPTPKADAKIPPPPQVPQKGSFTVWAEPDPPTPFKQYVIHVKVKLPKDKMSGYSASDLKGTMVGTDGYTCHIDIDMPLPKKIRKGDDEPCMDMSFDADEENGQAVLKFVVPGAKKYVKDVVTIRSEMLNEEQTIDLVFQSSAGSSSPTPSQEEDGS